LQFHRVENAGMNVQKRATLGSGKLAGMDRITSLREILSQDPTNALARYGLAMEYSNSGELDQALQEFTELLAINPEYTAAYFMAAQTLVKANRGEEAKRMLQNGMASAERKGDMHAQSEMQAMLDEIGGT
jgi:thioredoxin-like negative regulator of GroEL